MYSNGITIRQQGSSYLVTVDDGNITSDGLLILGSNGGCTVDTGSGNLTLSTTTSGDVIISSAGAVTISGSSTTHTGNFSMASGNTITVPSVQGDVVLADGYLTASQGVVIDSANSPHIRFRTDAGAVNWIMGPDQDNSDSFIISGSTSLDDEPRFCIEGRKIGLNTNSPTGTATQSELLHLRGMLVVEPYTSGNDSILLFREGGSSKFSMGYDDGLDSFCIAAGGSLSEGDEWLVAKDASVNQVAMGNAPTVDASATLKLDSTASGFAPPRMTTSQKNAISSPIAGLIVFDTDLSKLCVYSGVGWETITSS